MVLSLRARISPLINSMEAFESRPTKSDSPETILMAGLALAQKKTDFFLTLTSLVVDSNSATARPEKSPSKKGMVKKFDLTPNLIYISDYITKSE